MKKLILLLVTSLALNLSSCFNNSTEIDKSEDVQAEVVVTEKEEMRGMWLSFYEISDICKGKTEEEYRKNTEEIIKNLSDNKFNAIFYQVRAFSDALYKSEIFPTSRYITEYEGAEIAFDPLAIFIEIASEYNISVHAWVNPLRISNSTDISDISDENPAMRLYNEDEDLSSLIVCEKGLFYNPSDEGARMVILSGIKELMENYDIKGFQFDDYFYPEAEDINDGIHYNSYVENGGQLSLEDWRKKNVSSLVSSVYNLIKGYNENIVFGISPSASFEKNEKIFADVKLWCKEQGFVDYIMPQIYFGFENENMPFCKTAELWCQTERDSSVCLYIGLSPYKIGVADENAGSGKNEWINKENILGQQYEFLKSNTDFSGFALFSYSYCYGKNVNEKGVSELGVLTSML